MLPIQNFHYTRDITPKRVTSDGARPRSLAPEQYSSEKHRSGRWRHCQSIQRVKNRTQDLPSQQRCFKPPSHAADSAKLPPRDQYDLKHVNSTNYNLPGDPFIRTILSSPISPFGPGAPT